MKKEDHDNNVPLHLLLTSIAKGKECATISRHKGQHKQPHIL